MKSYLTAISIVLLTAILLFPGCSSSDQTTETQRLNDWLDEKYEESLQMSPMALTRLGRKDQYDRIDEMTEAEEERQLEWRGETVSEMKEMFDYEELSAEAKVSYDLWEYQYEIAKEGEQFRNHGYIFDQMRSIHTRLPTFLINFHRVDSLEDMNAYISRIEGLGRAINQLLERAETQAETGIRPPKFSHEIVIRQAESLITGAPFTESENESALWIDANRKISGLLEAGAIDSTQAESLREETRTALADHFQPAYKNLITWVQKDMEMAEESPVGVSRHPDGEAFYNYMLRYTTTTDLTADEIHELGLEGVEQIHNEMEAIIDEVEFEGTLQEFFEFINTDDQFFYPNTDEGRQGYLEASEDHLEAIEEKLPEFFGILPKAGLVVRRVEPFREQDGAPAHYVAGTPDGSRDGIYYIHLSDMNALNTTMREVIAYHEGNPGHHMQISIAQELDSVPEFRTQAGHTVYIEGWALYCEKVAKEMGGYEDPYSDFGRLTSELWRAIRLVVDTGIHAKGWTEADAFEYFSENSPVSESAIRAEVRRYMVMPGQATAYRIGMLKIQELREKAEQELGENFDIRGFHDTVLGSGSLPLHILESEVDRWIEGQKTDV